MTQNIQLSTDSTLQSFLDQGDDTYKYLEKYCIALSIDKIEEKIVQLQSSIKTIQSVAYYLANISNVANKLLLIKKRRSHLRAVCNEEKKEKYIDPHPTNNTLGTLRFLNAHDQKEIIKNIHIPIKTVSSISEIPISYVYYAEDIKQYVVNIAGLTIRGNLGNIVNYKTKNSSPCEYGKKCKCLADKKECPYYHDPDDYINNNIPVPETSRNFTVGSWIYTKDKTPRTYYARHIGSADRLIHDLRTLKLVQYRDEIFNREGQLIHDLLIYMILMSRGLVDKYSHWAYMPKKC